MKTISVKADDIERKWYVVDAEGQSLGRMASRIAGVLRGKHLPSYTPHVDTGDFVVVINCEKVKLTGLKAEQIKYHKHTGYVGNLKTYGATEKLEREPEFVVRHAVKGMLPKNKLGRKMFKKLKVYAGSEHPHAAQAPQALDLTAKAK